MVNIYELHKKADHFDSVANAFYDAVKPQIESREYQGLSDMFAAVCDDAITGIYWPVLGPIYDRIERKPATVKLSDLDMSRAVYADAGMVEVPFTARPGGVTIFYGESGTQYLVNLLDSEEFDALEDLRSYRPFNTWFGEDDVMYFADFPQADAEHIKEALGVDCYWEG